MRLLRPGAAPRVGEPVSAHEEAVTLMDGELIVPVLAAGPFRLRPFRLADLDLVRAAAGDPYIPLITTIPAVFTEDEGRRFIERQWSRAQQGYGYSFAIADAATDRALGQAGLWLQNIGQGRAEVGYWVIAAARGRGAAGRAVAAITGWALGELRIPRLELYVEPWNQASIRTAEKAGFRREGLLRSWQAVAGERKDMLMYSLLPGDRGGTGQ
jgi:RimJ/RimL family protein N-acetyltransferase